MMSPSPGALANRSFLYGAGGDRPDQRPPAPSDGKIVYATLDTLGLRLRQLAPAPAADEPAPRQPTKMKPTPLPKPKLLRPEQPRASQDVIVQIAATKPAPPAQEAQEAQPAALQAFDSESDSTNQSSGSLSSCSPAERSKQPKKKPQPMEPKREPAAGKKEKLTFAKNVLYYVPMTSRRYYRKSRKLASRTLGGGGGERSLKSCALSRDELKYVTISLPSNFVHVASATRDNLMPDAPVDEARLQLIAQRSKYADLRGAEYADIVLGPEDSAAVNNSFLWGRLPRPREEEQAPEDDDDYDDVGPAVEQFLGKCEPDSNVSRLQNKENKKKQPLEEEPEEQDEDDGYDDVIPVEQSTCPATASNQAQKGPTVASPEDDVYDDVGFSSSYEKPAVKSVQIRPESREEQVDDDVYDDVGLPLRLKSQECHERVNSLYAGSSVYNYCDKESEWEDLEDLAIYDDSGVKIEDTSHSSPCKKKLAGQRWSRKVRRQRSRASRKSSGRSTSRSRSRPKNPETVSDSSDDSNYETLETYEPDDFSSDSEAEGASPSAGKAAAPASQQQEPPSRPIPPPPREASLGHTLGRRIKMLRRTWSITKGSLGRMRRRASGECEAGLQPAAEPAPQHHGNNSLDARKYFSFKKHFRKNPATGLSTFYLDKAAPPLGADRPPEREEEPLYSNSRWYQEAGLYKAQQPEGPNSEAPDELAIDHYSVLTEEPLYQFYTAAATRVAFESDSDGYEEVEELTPSSATTDLAKPGHRTLWCQTPQVINSGLLQSLTAEERRVQEAKFEILTSEASYLNSLRVLENEFASNYELAHEVLTPAERDRLFGSVPEVLVASERFLAELEAVWREDLMLGRLAELLLRHAERSAGVYVAYCSNQVSIDTTLKELRAKRGPRFLEAVSRVETRPACQSLSLHSFLMLPMQRITRLPLLADAVLSKLSVEHGERLDWEAVLTALSRIVGKCNEAARLAERRNEMDALARKLEYPSKVPPVDLRERELIRSGTVVQLSTKSDSEYKLTFGRKFHKTPLMLMLLTDYLLVTKLKSNSNEETYSVVDTCKRSLVALESAPEDSPFAGRHAMVLTLLENHAGRQSEYVLTCENDTEKERWLDAVSPPKPSCVGETLYESWDCPQVMAVYSHSPSQPDELALQPGDVINVLRKMNDGWLFGEKLLDGEQGWFPGNFTKEVASEHVRARNLRQRHRFLALSGSVLQRKAKQSLSLL